MTATTRLTTATTTTTPRGNHSPFEACRGLERRELLDEPQRRLVLGEDGRVVRARVQGHRPVAVVGGGRGATVGVAELPSATRVLRCAGHDRIVFERRRTRLEPNLTRLALT